ncbi:hypothetical protein [Pedobacter sp.]|uniref:hypothetical protein n=1 Tax=Pedobacter sp. TaxID=1411316 RepID=UPI0031DE3934
MEKKTPRVILYPDDLHNFCACDKARYKLYNHIRQEFNLPKSKRITIYHLRDYFNISLVDARQAIFGE